MITRTIKWAIVTVIIVLLFSNVSIVKASENNNQHYNNNGKIDQGDLINIRKPNINNGGNCTIGYIDHSASRVYTAGHCGQSGDVVSILKDGDYFPVGIFDTYYNPNSYRNDIGWFDVKPELLGVNTYSDSKIVQPNIGQRLCSYGARSNKVHCGIILGFDGRIILSDKGGIPGDSGGPAWIPGQGFVGLYTVYWHSDNNLVGTGFTHLKGYDNYKNIPQPIDNKLYLLSDKFVSRA